MKATEKEKLVNYDLYLSDLRHSKILKIILIILTTILLTISGVFSGFLGSALSRLIFITPQTTEKALLLCCIVITLLIWITNASRTSLFSSLLKASLSGFLISLISIVILGEASFFITTLLFLLLALSLEFLSFITASLYLSLTLLLIKKNKYFTKHIYCLLVAFISAIVAFLSGQSLSGESTLSETNFVLIKLLLGFITGLTIAISASKVTNFDDNPNKNYIFLKNWAIAISTWGNTSYYNQDLSNANFRGANLANIDLRAKKFYRTCFQDATGLERARVDSRYLDLEITKVQKLLTHSYSEDKKFCELNLRGAYLQNADMRDFNLTDSELTGADLQGADLRGSILVRTQLTDVNFTRAQLTGICIKDWSVNSQTDFTEVECDYVYREIDPQGNPIDRFPINRNFEPREFESLYQEVGNVVELIFREGENWQAAFFSLKKIQLEDENLELEIKGIEKRGDLFVIKVIHSDNYSRQEVEQHLNAAYEEMRKQLATKEAQINQLIGIVDTQAKTLEGLSKKTFGNNFFISGSTITNLSGSGQIDYNEAANQVRNLVASSTNTEQVCNLADNLLRLFQDQSIAMTEDKQTELLEQIILKEATTNNLFRQFLLQQEEQIANSMPDQRFTLAMENALKQLKY